MHVARGKQGEQILYALVKRPTLPIGGGKTAAGGRRNSGRQQAFRSSRPRILIRIRGGVVRLASVTRRNLEMTAETSREVRDVLEANLIGDLGNRSMASRVSNQNLVGTLQPLGLDELANRRLIVVEQAVEIAQGNPTACSDLFRRERLVAEMAFDEIDDSASQVIPCVANVGCRAPVFRADRQRDEADDFGRQRLGIGGGELMNSSATLLIIPTSRRVICSFGLKRRLTWSSMETSRPRNSAAGMRIISRRAFLSDESS